MRNLSFDQGNPHCNWSTRTDLPPNAKLFQNTSTKGVTTKTAGTGSLNLPVADKF